MVRDRHVDLGALDIAAGEGAVGGCNLQLHRLADEFETCVPHQRARQKAGLGQHLKAIADPKNETASSRVFDHRLRDRRLGRDGATAQIVAKREPARNRHQIDAGRQLGILVPDHGHIGARLTQGHGHVAITVGTGEDDDGSFHGALRVAELTCP